MLPTISVIVPTCDRHEMLSSCLDILRQSVAALPENTVEIIVSDDGKHSSELVCTRYPNVRWTDGPKRGPASNRNHGARIAQGVWLVFLDDDCLPGNNWLKSYLDQTTSDGKLFEGRTTCTQGLHSPLEHSPINETGGYLWSCNFMIRADLFRELSGFDERFRFAHMEDVDLRERLRDRGEQSIFVPEAVVDHPPRRLPWGLRLARTHESEVYFWRMKRGQGFGLLRMLTAILDARIRTLLKYPPTTEWLSAVASTIVELVGVIAFSPQWYRNFPKASASSK